GDPALALRRGRARGAEADADRGDAEERSRPVRAARSAQRRVAAARKLLLDPGVDLPLDPVEERVDDLGLVRPPELAPRGDRGLELVARELFHPSPSLSAVKRERGPRGEEGEPGDSCPAEADPVEPEEAEAVDDDGHRE